MKRHAWGCGATVAATLATLGAFAWATLHPRDPYLDRLTEYPVLGALALWIQETWAPSPPPLPAPLAVDAPEENPAELPPQARLVPVPNGPKIWAHAGQRLHLEPSHESGVTLTFGFPTTVVWTGLERDGWRQIVTEEGLEGWLPPRITSVDPPLGRAPSPVVAASGFEPDARLLTAAQALLPGTAEGRLGPWRLLTDCDDPALLQQLDRLARGLESAFASRYGVTPGDRARELVVLFQTQQAYRQLASEVPDLAGLEPTGHFGGGVVALALNGRAPDEVESTLIHELAHTLTRRAIGPALPPWLAEGIADDLASFAGTPGASLDLSRRRVVTERVGSQLLERGWGVTLDQANLYRLHSFQSDRAYAGDLETPLAVLTALDHGAFVRPPAASRYALAAVLVSTLLDRPETADRFRRLLADVAAGAPIGPRELEDAVGQSLDQMERSVADAIAGAASGSSSRQSDEPSS